MSSVSARDAILGAVRAARPPAVAAPAAHASRSERHAGRLTEAFADAAIAAGAVVLTCARSEVARLVIGAAENAPKILSVVPGVGSSVAIPADPHELADLNLFVCEASLGVAENGAVWISTSDAWQRAALFLAERVLIVLDARAMVADLHDAYARIDVRANSFGSFIAGPSKTADIEQALVVGAHGPKELTVIVLSDEAIPAAPSY